MLIKVKELKKGDTIALQDGQHATVTKIATGDQSPFGRIKGVRFCQRNPMTVYFTDGSFTVVGADSQVERGNNDAA